jgi:hypothetical protein
MREIGQPAQARYVLGHASQEDPHPLKSMRHSFHPGWRLARPIQSFGSKIFVQ